MSDFDRNPRGFVMLSLDEYDKYRAWVESGKPSRQPPPVVFQKQEQNNPEVKMLTKREVANLMRTSTRTIERMCDEGRMPAPLKLGANVRWNSEVVQAWINAGCPSKNFDN